MTSGNSANNVAVAGGLFSGSADSPVLLGCRCKDCGEHFFPSQPGCSNCSSEDMESVELGDNGVLWSWTIQGFCPKSPFYAAGSPDAFKPYGVGYVEMPCGLKVESRLLESTVEQLKIGMPMRLVLEPLYTNDQGQQVMGFAFTSNGSGA